MRVADWNRAGKVAVLILVFLLCAVSLVTATEVLVILPSSYGANYFLTRDILDQFGWNVTLTGTTEVVAACPWARGVALTSIHTDTLLCDIDDITNYDIVLISTGSNYASNPFGNLIESEDCLQLLQDAREAGIVIGAWCGAVRVLAAADIIDGVQVTGHANYEDEYVNAGAIYLGSQIPPVIDQNIVTATRGMYFNQQNCEALDDALAISRMTDNRRGQ